MIKHSTDTTTKANDSGLGYLAPVLAGLYGTPTAAALGVGGYSLARLLGMKKKRYLALGLPAAYLTYVLGKKGNGFGLWNGVGPIDNIAGRINDATHLGLWGIFQEKGLKNKLSYGGKYALLGLTDPNTEDSEATKGWSTVASYTPPFFGNEK